MQNSIYINEDERRKLIEWVSGEEQFKAAKVVIANSRLPVGLHYHRRKREIFLLLSGHAQQVQIGNQVEVDVAAPKKWVVNRGVYHGFILEPGSILLGVATELFDPEDEIKDEDLRLI